MDHYFSIMLFFLHQLNLNELFALIAIHFICQDIENNEINILKLSNNVGMRR